MSVSQCCRRGGGGHARSRAHHRHKRAHIDGLTQLAREAGATDPDTLANQLELLYEGACGLSTSLNDPAPWTRARAAAETLIDEALSRSV